MQELVEHQAASDVAGPEDAEFVKLIDARNSKLLLQLHLSYTLKKRLT
jgi:hypothetical protein